MVSILDSYFCLKKIVLIISEVPMWSISMGFILIFNHSSLGSVIHFQYQIQFSQSLKTLTQTSKEYEEC